MNAVDPLADTQPPDTRGWRVRTSRGPHGRAWDELSEREREEIRTHYRGRWTWPRGWNATDEAIASYAFWLKE
jgi:hypothetical protein